MATQTVEFRSPPSQTVTAKLFAIGSDTQVASVTATEATNRKGTYSAAYTDVAAGEYELIALVGAVSVARWFVTLTLTTATFQAYDKVGAVELDPATRVKLDATQPDYAPATPAQVNAQVLDVLSVDTFAELSAPPAATSSLKDKITWLFMYARNKVTQTATTRTLYRDDTTTVAGTSGTSDNGTTFTKGEDA